MRGWFGNDDQIVVFEQDIEIDLLRLGPFTRDLGKRKNDLLPRFQSIAGLTAAVVDADGAAIDDPPEMDAAVIGQMVGEKDVQPPARLAVGHGQFDRIGRFVRTPSRYLAGSGRGRFGIGLFFRLLGAACRRRAVFFRRLGLRRLLLGRFTLDFHLRGRSEAAGRGRCPGGVLGCRPTRRAVCLRPCPTLS